MTILQVCAYAAPYEGNFIKSLQALRKELIKHNIRMVYAFPENARNIDWVCKLAQETDVYFLPLKKARIRLKTYRKLREIYNKYPDLAAIHSHFELYDVPVVLTAPQNVKVFWHLHDALEIYNSFRNRMVHKIQYGMLHKNATLLSVSEKHMNYVMSCGFPQQNAYFVPNGLDTDRIKCVESNDPKYDFLIFGWEFERKGVDLCISAIKQSQLKCRVAIVGSENTEKMIAERYGSVPQVQVIEPEKDINKLYAATKCFLHISRAEGLSYALLEAVYAGLPVICSDISENLFAQQFSTVRMVKSEDVHSIANAMNEEISRKRINRETVEAARIVIEKNYSVACWVRNMLKWYGVENA